MKDVERVLKIFVSMKSALFSAVNKDLGEQAAAIQTEIDAAQNHIDKMNADLRNSKRSVRVGPDDSIQTSKAFDKKSFESAVTADPKLTEGMLGVKGHPVRTFEKFSELIALIKTATEGTAISFETLSHVAAGTAQSTAEIDTFMTDILSKSGVNLTNEQLLLQLQKNNVIETQKESDIQKTINAQKEIESKIMDEQHKMAIEENNLFDVSQKVATAGSSQPSNQHILNLTSAIDKLASSVSGSLNKGYKELEGEQDKVLKSTKKLDEKTKEHDTSLGRAAKNVFSYGTAYQFLRRIYRETIKTITQLDAALTEMSVVTAMSRQESWKLISTFQDLATQTGFTTTEIAKLSTVYFRQGRTLQDVIELTTVAAKAARIAGISAQESANYLTAAVNGFGLAAKDALAVSDKFAALAASSASSYEELALGLSKFASQAKVAGLSIDFAMGLLAKGVETTREAPESIGTALKTVLARMRELTDLGKTMEDGMDFNRVDKALRQVGITITDTNGQFRDMETVLTEIGQSWDTYNSNQKASIAVSLAGTRQQSRLIAMFQDFDRTLELVQTSEESAGATMAQHAEYMKSMQAASTNLTTAWQKFITTITDSEVIIGVIKLITNVINGVSKGLEDIGLFGKNAMIVIFGLIGAFVAYTKIQKISIALKLKDNIVSRALNFIRARSVAITYSETGAVIVNTKAQIANTVARLGLIGVIMLVVAALAYLTYKIIESSKKEEESVKQRNEALQIQRYEINQTIKSFDKLIKKYDELNSKAIKTDEDIQALKDLETELKNIEGLQIVYDNLTGEINFEQTLANLKFLRKLQQQQLDATFYQGFNSVFENIEKRYQEFEKLRERGKTNSRIRDSLRDEIPEEIEARAISRQEAIKKSFEENKQIVVDYYTNEFNILQDRNLTSQQINIVRKYYDKVLNSENFRSFEGNAKIFLETYENLFESIEDASRKGFSAQLEVYREIQKNLSQSSDQLNQEIAESLSETYRLLDYYSQLFKDTTGEFANIFEGEKLSLDFLNKLSKAAIKAQVPFEELLYKAALYKEAYINKSGVSPILAQSMAWSRVAESVEDVALKTELYTIAASGTTLNLVQSIDTLNSSIKRISEVQSKMLSGDLTQTELYDFLQENLDLFSDDGMMDKFLSGGNIILDLINNRLDLAKTYSSQLISIESQLTNAKKQLLEEDTYQNRMLVESLQTQKNQLLILRAYKGELANVTEAQFNYNKILEQKNRLQKLGIVNDALNLELLKNLGTYTAQQVKRTVSGIDAANEKIFESIGINAAELYEVINGTVVVSQNAINRLNSNQMTTLQEYTNYIQTQYDIQLDAFKNLKDQQIAIEKEKSDKQKKVYEDYFDALDRIERMRERKLSRDDIVKQLQRLEGATDERSRQKAKELRAELIQMDKTAAKDEQKQAREDLLKSFDNKMIELEEQWSKAGEDFIEAMSIAGTDAGEAMVAVLRANGLISDDEINTDNVFNPNNPEDINTTDVSPINDFVFNSKEFFDGIRSGE